MNNLTLPVASEMDLFEFNISDFEEMAIRIFRFQCRQNEVYQGYLRAIHVLPDDIKNLAQIPFLPISFFKTHRVTSTSFQPELVFESSGTTGPDTSRHFIRKSAIYTQSYLTAFRQFYGNPGDWCILGLLPSYLERKNSSLVKMVDGLIKLSAHPKSGFYLNQFEALYQNLVDLENRDQPTLLIGVTFALLDFAEKYPLPLKHTIIMETGGMKGRREEMTRGEVHGILKKAFQTGSVHSEYGMTELLSQAYAKRDGIFYTPPWMRVILRSEDDPFERVQANNILPGKSFTGVINIVDFANIYSASFIATDDIGRLYHDGSFEVLGRLDNSDIRGCSLLSL